MKWIDTADDVVAKHRQRGQPDPRVLSREEYNALPLAERQSTVGTTVVAGVSYRGEAEHAWIRVTLVAIAGEEDRWTIWDSRGGPVRATPIATGVPTRRLALSLGALAATSRATRIVLGTIAVASAALVAWREVVQRERPR